MISLETNKPFAGISNKFTRSSVSREYYYFQTVETNRYASRVNSYHRVIYYIAKVVSRLFGAHFITRSNVSRLLEVGRHNIEHFRFSTEAYLEALHTVRDICKVLTELCEETSNETERTKMMRLIKQASDFSDIIMHKIFEVELKIQQHEYWPEIMRSYCEIKFELNLVDGSYHARNMNTLLKQFAKDGHRGHYIKLKKGQYSQPQSLSEYFNVDLLAETEDAKKALIKTCCEKYKRREYREQEVAIMLLVDQFGQNESGLLSTSFRVADLLSDYDIPYGLDTLARKSDLYVINRETESTISITKYMRFFDISNLTEDFVNYNKWFEIDVEIEFDKRKLRQMIEQPEEGPAIRALKKHYIKSARWNPLISQYLLEG